MKLPGFIDSHMHFLGLGYVNFNADLTSAKSITDLQTKLRTSESKIIIIGRGWNQTNFIERRMPTKSDLNLISRDLPIVIIRVCGHVLVVNDKMLEIANITKDSKQISGGSFDFETGIFSENAINLIYNEMPKPTKEDITKYLIKANDILLSRGITQVASDDFSTLPLDYEFVISTIKDLYKEGLLQVKITEQVNLNYELLQDFINKGYVNKRFGNFRMGPLKILADGSLGGKTASLNEPYENEPSNYGIKTYSDEELFKLIYLADSNNMDVVIHAIGDDASDQAINALIKSLKLTKRKSHNHALIHAQLTTKIQIEKMKQWNIGAIIQPIFLNSDIQIIESRIGSRCFESYLFKTMFDSGIHVGFSTDSPIEPVNPFANIYSAVTRRSIKSPELDPFLIEESFTVENAILCYTYNNVRYTYENELNEKDYIITDTNIYSCPLEKIKDIKVLETYIDNKLIYKNKE